MADEPRKLSDLPTATSIGVNDRFAILYNANTSSPSTRTVSGNNVLKSLFSGAPTYSNNANAVTGGLAVGQIYKTANGEIRIVV